MTVEHEVVAVDNQFFSALLHEAQRKETEHDDADPITTTDR
jgi:hypothetical protein